MPFDEDLSAFFHPDDFGDVATFQPADGRPPFEVRGIFDDAYEMRRARDVEQESRSPQMLCSSLAVINVRREDRCVIRGRTFDVLAVKPDGTGLSVVVLDE